MSKHEGKTDLVKPAKTLAKGGTTNTSSGIRPPPPKRPITEVSPNSSVEEITVINHHLESLSDDVKSVRDDLKNILKKDEMEQFIKSTIHKIISELNENMEMTITMKVEEKTKHLENTINNLQSENSTLKKEVSLCKTQLSNLKIKIEDSEIRSKDALSKANYNEQYSRKNTIKIMDIIEKENEAEDDLLASATDLFQKQGITINPTKILAIHRIPGKAGHPKPVLMKLTNNTEKTKIMRLRSTFKGMGHRLVDDVTKHNAELIRRLTAHDSIEQAWYFNGSVYGKTTSGRRHKFDMFDNISDVINH